MIAELTSSPNERPVHSWPLLHVEVFNPEGVNGAGVAYKIVHLSIICAYCGIKFSVFSPCSFDKGAAVKLVCLLVGKYLLLGTLMLSGQPVGNLPKIW